MMGASQSQVVGPGRPQEEPWLPLYVYKGTTQSSLCFQKISLTSSGGENAVGHKICGHSCWQLRLGL